MLRWASYSSSSHRTEGRHQNRESRASGHWRGFVQPFQLRVAPITDVLHSPALWLARPAVPARADPIMFITGGRSTLSVALSVLARAGDRIRALHEDGFGPRVQRGPTSDSESAEASRRATRRTAPGRPRHDVTRFEDSGAAIARRNATMRWTPSARRMEWMNEASRAAVARCSASSSCACAR